MSPDNLQPNVITVNPDGTIGATFTGTVYAKGLTLGATDSTAETPNTIQWVRQADGAVVASVAQDLVIDPTTDTASRRLLLTATQDASAGDTGAEVMAYAIDGAGGRHYATIIDTQSRASFLQLPTLAQLAVQAGNGTLSAPAGTSLNYIDLPIAWPGSHVAFIATAFPASTDAAGNYTQGAGTYGLAQGKLQIVSTIGQNWNYSWISLGY